MKRDSGIPNSLACFGSNSDNSISGSKKNRSQPVKWPPIAVLKIANPIISEPVSAMLSNNSSNVSITVFNKVQIRPPATTQTFSKYRQHTRLIPRHGNF